MHWHPFINKIVFIRSPIINEKMITYALFLSQLIARKTWPYIKLIKTLGAYSSL